jgi:rhodanese-related sulfurtransferase
VLWVLPLVTVVQAILRLRAIAEHGATTDFSSPLTAARTNVARAWLEWLIFPHQVNYHIAHHLYASVPHYNLPALHREMSERGLLQNAEVVPFSVTEVPMRALFHMAAFIGEGLPNFEIRQVRKGTDLLVRDATLGRALAQSTQRCGSDEGDQGPLPEEVHQGPADGLQHRFADHLAVGQGAVRRDRDAVVQAEPLEVGLLEPRMHLDLVGDERLRRGERPVIVDVREPHEWDIANLGDRGAELIPLGSLPERMAELDTADEIVLHCRSGARSAQALEQLREAGFGKLWNLKGGILGWQEEVDPSLPRY